MVYYLFIFFFFFLIYLDLPRNGSMPFLSCCFIVLLLINFRGSSTISSRSYPRLFRSYLSFSRLCTSFLSPSVFLLLIHLTLFLLHLQSLLHNKFHFQKLFSSPTDFRNKQSRDLHFPNTDTLSTTLAIISDGTSQAGVITGGTKVIRLETGEVTFTDDEARNVLSASGDAYTLTVDVDTQRIEIVGRENSGVFYGIVSLGSLAVSTLVLLKASRKKTAFQVFPSAWLNLFTSRINIKNRGKKITPKT